MRLLKPSFHLRFDSTNEMASRCPVLADALAPGAIAGASCAPADTKLSSSKDRQPG